MRAVCNAVFASSAQVEFWGTTVTISDSAPHVKAWCQLRLIPNLLLVNVPARVIAAIFVRFMHLQVCDSCAGCVCRSSVEDVLQQNICKPGLCCICKAWQRVDSGETLFSSLVRGGYNVRPHSWEDMTIGVARGPCPPKIFSTSNHFVLWEATSQTKVLLFA